MNLLTKKALDEYNGEIAKHHGGINGRPFWNTNSSQFIYNPCFGFPIIPGAKSYLFTANDCNGVTRSFKAEKPTSLLTPIWKDLPAGIVELKVEALDEDGNIKYLAGARTFFKCDPFPGRENLPPKACTYRECALKGLRYVYSHSMVKYLLEHEKPDPDYDYNAYPSKTLGSLISAMIAYSKLEPENSKNALKIATIAADYLISITYREDSHLAGLPPTYSTDFCDDDKKYDTYVAVERVGKVMMVYPPNVAKSYLELEEITGEKRFFDAALKIAQYYERNIQPNGSWYLFVSEETGKAENENYCVPCSIIELMHLMYEKTNDTKWLELEEKGYQYIERNCIETYNWEGQFEDAGFSNNYSNLTHFAANNIVRYITKTKAEEDLETAINLMRYIEDQFVVWGKFAPWSRNYKLNEYWESPAGLEQYDWYLPIDGSTSTIMISCLELYKVTNDSLWYEKACALADKITRMQNPETGVIPTQWVTKNANTEIWNFWLNCHLSTSLKMYEMSVAVENE